MDSNELVALISGSAFVLGSVLAFVGSFVAARFTAKATLRQERERDRLVDRRERRAFQRQTLLDAQDELTKFARVQGEIWLFDQHTYKDRGEYTQMPPELSERARLAQVSFTHLIERVVDDAVRTTLKYVAAVDMRRVIPSSPANLDAAVREFAESVQAAGEVLGKKLREYLADEDLDTD